MTDTQPLVPTDAEIEAVVQACRERGLRELDVFRAVVVKFGTPALVGREPVAEVVPCYTPSGKRVALYSAKQDLPIGTKLYAAPQPTQAQADGFFLLLPQRPKPEAPAGTAGLDWDAYSGAQMLAFGRDCSDAANAALRTQQPAPAQPDQPIACSYGDNGYACCEGGPCQADVHNDKLAEQQAPATAQAEESTKAISGTQKQAICDACGSELLEVLQSPNSYLSAEQFDADKLGDWYCKCCPKGPSKGSSTHRYFWNRDLGSTAAQAAEPVAWLRNTTDPQPHAVTNLKYRSAVDAEAGVEYIPVFAGPQPVAREPLDEARRRLFDAGWKAAALFCDREDVVADGIIGFGACPQFEAAFSAAHGIKGGQHDTE